MQNTFKMIGKKHLIFFTNSLVGLFFLTVLSFEKGYSYSPIILGIISTIAFFIYTFKLKIKWQLDRESKYFIFSLIAYFLTFLMSVFIHQDKIRVIDNPSKILLFIPILFFFSLYPIKQKLIFYMFPISSLVVGVLAVYQQFMLGLPKPFPYTMHIQAGDIAMALSLLGIAVAFYWFNQGKNKIALTSLVFAALGILGSLLTGARGGWIAFPPCFLLILIFNFKSINKKVLLIITALFAIALSIFITKPEFGFHKRYNEAKADITNYIEKADRQSSLGARFDMWENALVAISEKPILGHGNLGYTRFQEKQISSQKMAATTLQFHSLHNQYLEAFVKRGVIGFSGLMAILFIPLIIFARRLKTEDTSVKCLAVLGIVHITSHMFFFLSQSFFSHNSGSIFYFFVLILLYHLIKQKENSHQ